jgi:hypothetical protein
VKQHLWAKTKSNRRPGRLLFVGFMLLSFLFQSYATQTHIHPLQGIPGITALKLTPVQHSNKSNPSGEPGDCSLCQAAMHGNAVFTPLVNMVAPDAMFFISLPVFFAPVLAALYRGHDEQQRGPPTP